MNDQEFLTWIYERLKYAHKEDPNADFMRRLRSIIENSPAHCDGTAAITTRGVKEALARQDRLDALLASGLDDYIADAISMHESQFHNEA